MISLWVGLGIGAGLLFWAVAGTPGAMSLLSPVALALVVGGTFAVVIIQSGLSVTLAGWSRALRMLLPSTRPTAEAAIAEAVRLARKAQAEGGLLALQGEGGDFADGFLARAIGAAVSSGETAEVRRVMDTELMQFRQERLQEAEVFQSMAAAAPILGLMGTLLGMIRAVAAMSDPAGMGQAMAMALSSDFIALALAQLVCSPLAGRLVAQIRAEVLIREIVLEGILGVMSARPVYRIELHLAAYSRRRQRQAQQAVAVAGRATEVAA